jgi:hypothetical protein
VSQGRRIRRDLPLGRITGTEAQVDGRTVRQDGDATQHQGFQVETGHGRPPANVEKGGRGRAPSVGYEYGSLGYLGIPDVAATSTAATPIYTGGDALCDSEFAKNKTVPALQ